jgi:histidinol phosphatase-like PHP family hydrolase
MILAKHHFTAAATYGGIVLIAASCETDLLYCYWLAMLAIDYENRRG